MLVFKIEDKFLEQDQVILYKISFFFFKWQLYVGFIYIKDDNFLRIYSKEFISIVKQKTSLIFIDF